ncbi:MAG: recombinase family protein, partial [Pseudobdellovibrionaceae bacterium]
MNKAVIYVRVSSKEQEREGFSIPAQKKYLNEYAIENDIKVVRIFEESESAKIAGRTQFKQMLQFLKSNLDVKHILVEKT